MKEIEYDDKWHDTGDEFDEAPDSTPEPGDERFYAEEPEPLDSTEPLDAMSPEVAPGLALIESLRIYDVLISLYRHFDEEAAERLIALHAEGKILGPLPYLDPDTE